MVLALFGPSSYNGSVGDSQSLKPDAHVGVLNRTGKTMADIPESMNCLSQTICSGVGLCVWMNEVFSLMWAIIWLSWEEQEEWRGKYSAQIQTAGPFLNLVHAGEKRIAVDQEQTKTQECRDGVKKKRGGMKRTEKESTGQNKLEPCVNRVYRNQIWPILKVIYRENAFSRVH